MQLAASEVLSDSAPTAENEKCLLQMASRRTKLAAHPSKVAATEHQHSQNEAVLSEQALSDSAPTAENEKCLLQMASRRTKLAAHPSKVAATEHQHPQNEAVLSEQELSKASLLQYRNKSGTEHRQELSKASLLQHRNKSGTELLAEDGSVIDFTFERSGTVVLEMIHSITGTFERSGTVVLEVIHSITGFLYGLVSTRSKGFLFIFVVCMLCVLCAAVTAEYW